MLTCSSSLTPLSTRGKGLSVEPGEEEEEEREKGKKNKQGDTSAISQLPASVIDLKDVLNDHPAHFIQSTNLEKMSSQD